jgi:hypothetical protein
MKGITLFLLSLVFLGLGVLMLLAAEPVVGTLALLLGVAGIGGAVIKRGQRRGDDRAGGTQGPLRGPYLWLGTTVTAIGAAIGVLFIVFTPVLHYSSRYRFLMGTPASSRIAGIVVVALCVIGVIALVTRARRVVRR